MGPLVPFPLRSAIASIELFVAYGAATNSVERNRRENFAAGRRREIFQLEEE